MAAPLFHDPQSEFRIPMFLNGQLPRRRLMQISLLEILLLMTASVALIVSFQARVMPTFAYTVGFAGGLIGAGVALSRSSCTAWRLLAVGTLSGVLFGMLGVAAFELYSPWDPWLVRVHGRFSTWEPAALGLLSITRGGLGGFVATVLFTALLVTSDWARTGKTGAATR